jgi:hypothetical protein
MNLPRGTQVSEAELAAIDAGLRLYLGLEPDPG